MIRYDKLFGLLAEQGLSYTTFLRANGFYSATTTKLKKNQTITTETINKLCQLLHCQPGDIMEYVEDTEE